MEDRGQIKVFQFFFHFHFPPVSDKPGSFSEGDELLTPCSTLRDLHSTPSYIRSLNKVLLLPGSREVSCEDDGSFSSTQCIEHVCSCVDYLGRPRGDATFYVWQDSDCDRPGNSFNPKIWVLKFLFLFVCLILHCLKL